jgi:copper chaperone CopZ
MTEAYAADPKEGTAWKKTILIEGMSCNHCKMHVEEALSRLAGVQSAAVDLKAKNAKVFLDASERTTR